MDEATQECSGRQHHRAATERGAVGGRDTNDGAAFHDQIFDRGGAKFEAGLVGQRLAHGLFVQSAVGLRAGTAHRRTLAPVEDAKLDARSVGDPPHDAVHGVDLADQVALADTANGGIARHLANGLDLVG